MGRGWRYPIYRSDIGGMSLRSSVVLPIYRYLVIHAGHKVFSLMASAETLSFESSAN